MPLTGLARRVDQGWILSVNRCCLTIGVGSVLKGIQDLNLIETHYHDAAIAARLAIAFNFRGGGKFQVQLSAVYDVAVRYTPVGRLSAFVQRRLAFASDDRVDKPSEPNILKLESKYSCYVTNKALIEQACRHFAVTPIFVWQPVPGYKYDMQYHLFVSSDRHRMTGDFYTFMDERSRDQPDVFGENFLWCADIQADEKECLYVDNHHYTAKFTEQFANAIVDRTAERGLLAQRDIINK